MIKNATASIALLWIMIACSSVDVATTQSQAEQEQKVTPFLFEYSFTETPPNRGDGADTKRKFIKVGLKGEYVASKELIPSRNHVGYTYSKNGVLSNHQLAKLEEIVEKLDLASINHTDLYLARGGGIEYGWGGHLTYMQDGRSYNIKFTSKHSQTQILDPRLKTRFFSFIRDMDDFFLAEINY